MNRDTRVISPLDLDTITPIYKSIKRKKKKDNNSIRIIVILLGLVGGCSFIAGGGVGAYFLFQLFNKSTTNSVTISQNKTDLAATTTPIGLVTTGTSRYYLITLGILKVS